MKSGASFRDSNFLQNQLTSKNNLKSGNRSDMKPIDENLEQSESEKSESRTTQHIHESDSDEEDKFGRSGEKIDLATVEVKSSATKSPGK